MADDLMPTPARRRVRRGYPLAVAAAGALLVFCAVLPWSGWQATSSLIDAGVASDLRGIDHTSGIYTLLAGLVALGCGLAGLLSSHPRLAALAVLPGGSAVVLVLRYPPGGGGLRDLFAFELGDVLSIAPVFRFGWFAALGCALALVVLSVLALLRRP
ncbi:hypothetical protein [Nonomuraea sp. NPDC050202]|uniref:hypothetical protein n=1 Tax=Nonomuraea sp. NPDC050202 TaxID=3155035 RepID=UPI0033C613D6